MSASFSIYTSFADEASHYTWIISFITWVIYLPMDELVSSRGIYLGPKINNIVEYSAVIELLLEEMSLGIFHLLVNLESQLMVSQLNNVYYI